MAQELHIPSPANRPDEPHVEDTAVLLSVAQALATAHDLSRVTQVVRTSARALTGADGVTFVVREGEFVRYVDEDAISPLWKGCRFPADVCISGWAMIHKQTVIIEDILLDDRIPHAAYQPTFVKSLAMVPVGSGEPVAAIGAYWATRHKATPREVRVLEILASQASAALVRHALEAELRIAVRTRTDLVAAASHELRTPIAAVRLQLEHALRLLARRQNDAAQIRNVLERATRSTARLTKLVEALLDVTRLGNNGVPLDLADVDLCEAVRDVLDRLRDTQTAPLRLTVNANGAVRGRWDRVRIEQVIENLVANAAKFAMDGDVVVTVDRAGEMARVVVSDAGPGIPLEHQTRIFEPFSRAARTENYGGLGLGLWIVRQNVEAHGGTIRLTSQPGAGSTFTVLLPVVATER